MHNIYRVAEKWHIFALYNLIKYWTIFKHFHCENQAKIFNDTTTKDINTSQMCRYTTL